MGTSLCQVRLNAKSGTKGVDLLISLVWYLVV